MTAPARRVDRRGIATRAALIERAETLFAERGIEGASLREIGAAIGAANVNVVHYHFGSKDALIAATIAHRLPAIDRRRSELLAAAEAGAAPLLVGQMLDVVFRPLFEQTNSAGRHSYVAFLHSLHRSNSLGHFVSPSPDYPATLVAIERLRGLAGLAAEDFARRMQIVFAMIAAAIVLMEAEASTLQEQAERFAEALAMAEAVLTVRQGI